MADNPDTTGSPSRLSLTRMRENHMALMQRLNALPDDPDSAFLADITAFQASVQAAGAAISGPDERGELQSTINFWQTVRIHAGERPPALMVAAFDQAAARAAAAGQSPYRGLLAFGTADGQSFFGRYRAVIDMVAIAHKQRLLAVIGLSGSGKSSAVRAGLLPELIAGAFSGEGEFDSRQWHYPEPIVPGVDPLAALSSIWGPIATPADFVASLDAKGAPVVLTVDQFEEVFTLAPKPDDSVQTLGPSHMLFLDALVAAATTGRFRHLIIVTMRSEYDSYVQTHPGFTALYSTGTYNIRTLEEDELRLAIEQPAIRLGVGFDQGLVENLVKGVLGEPAGLPLLQFTLLQLWDRRIADGPMRMEAYTALGGNPKTILARRADEIFVALLEQDQVLSRRIFLELVSISSGQEATSRRIKRSALDALGPRDNIDLVLGIWRGAGLIRIAPAGPITAESSVEAAHEALLRNWKKLVDWVDDQYVQVRSRKEFRRMAEQWQADPQKTLGALELKDALQYDQLGPLETSFIAASQQAVEKAKADLTRQQKRWLWATLFMIAGEIGVAAGLMWWIWTEDDPPFLLITTTVILVSIAVVLVQFLVADTASEAVAGYFARRRNQSEAKSKKWQRRIRFSFRWGSGIGIVFVLLMGIARFYQDGNKAYAQDDLDAATASFDASGQPVLTADDWPDAQAVRPTLARLAAATGLSSAECPTAPTVFMVADGVALGVISGPLPADAATGAGCTIDFSPASDNDPAFSFAVDAIRAGPIIAGAEAAGAAYSQIVTLQLAPKNAAGRAPPPAVLLSLAEDTLAYNEVNLTGAIIGYAITGTAGLTREAQAISSYDFTAEGEQVFKAQFRRRSVTDPSFEGGAYVDIRANRVIGINLGATDTNEVADGWTYVMVFDRKFITEARAKGLPVQTTLPDPAPPSPDGP